MHPGVFWTGMALIVVVGTFLAVSRGAQEDVLTSEQEEIIEEIEAAEGEFGGGGSPSESD
jgi:hypothetical protein